MKKCCSRPLSAFLATLALAMTGSVVTEAQAQECPASPDTGLIAFEVGVSTVLGHIPETAAGKRVPLVLNLHPSGGSGLRSLEDSRHVADENGFVLVTPTGDVGPIFGGWTWNVPGVPTFGEGNYPAEDARNEVEFLSQVIDKASEIACIDPKRIYIMGFSGGARMASRMACDMADRIAAIAPIGGIRFSNASDTELGLPNAQACTPSRPVPVMALHGHWDPTNVWYDSELGETPFLNPSDGSKRVAAAPKPGTSWSYSGEAALARWVEHNGCSLEPKITDIADDVQQRDYQDCRDGGNVTLMFFEDGGHAVPGYDTAWGPGQGISDFDGYAVAWDLLKSHNLPE